MGSSAPSTQSSVSAQVCAYSPLKDGEIRVLDLLPGRQSDSIECELHVVNVNEYTDYTAISYVWGTEPWSRMIRVDGTNMPVSPNLEAALLQIRLSSNSIPEEADAFGSMFKVEGIDCPLRREKLNSIKANAKRLLIWLGSEADESNKAMELIDTLDSRRSQYNQEEEQERIKNCISSSSFQEACIALGALVSRPWFSRCWILQEYILGFRGVNGIFQCGPKRIPCAKLESIHRFFSDEELSPSLDIIFRSAIDKMAVFTYLRVNYKRNHSPTTHLANLLYQSRKAASTDPRDKIYSILGILQKGFENNDKLSTFDTSSLIIDYSASVQDVYSSFVKAVVDQTRQLHILGNCCAQGSQVKRTWTPDWTMPATEGFLGLNYEIRKAKFRASKQTDSQVRFSHDLTTMTANGFVFDNVHFVVNEPVCNVPENDKHMNLENNQRTNSEFRVEMAKLWEVMKMNTPYGTENDTRLNLWRALFTDPDSDIPLRLELAEFMRRIEGETSSGTTSWSHPTLLDRLPNAMNFNDRIFLTNKGYVGKILYSDRIRNDDLICILFGCPTPVVLRRVVDHYIYVGDVYVAGIMYGEAMDSLDDGKFQLQDFVLH